MKTERGLFEEWLKYYEKHDVVTDQLQRAFMWQAWQASAQRQDYKLVPCEPTKEMLIAADNCVIDGKVTSHNIYKAMIGAAP